MNEATLPRLLSLFKHTNAFIIERFDELRIVLELAEVKNLNIDAIVPATAFLNARDTLLLSVIVDDGEPVDFYSGGDSSEFTSELESKFSILDDEAVSFTLRISKNIVDGVISIYNYQDFILYLNSLTIQAVYQEFSSYIQKAGFLIFEFQSTENTLKSNSIWFVDKGFTGTPEVADRQSKINKAKSSCHFNYLSKFVLNAEDFAVESQDLPELADFMNRLATILSIAYLFDITSLHGDTLEYRLNGYKSINGTVDLKLLETEPDHQYYKIYNWVYDSGNFTDKTGLARNIISLHLEQLNNLSLKGEPFTSIQSSYKVYEKQNIKQYIEIRNKISDQLLGFHDRANKIIETFASGFQKSAFALMTFYISAIILKVLSKDKLIEVFTIDAATLSTAFILCSIVYYFVLKWEVNAQKLRFENNYVDVKLRYTDLLDEQDINRILNNDHEFTSDLQFVDDKAKYYTIMWFVFLGIFFFTTWLLYFIYNPALLHEIRDWLTHYSSTPTAKKP
ncbi:hypothetical protein [Mucilaginibacter glaciei]|uniref:Uncharacterized protein n=1 Tax=Mucilaginibacter glaciei TaxID=2772109 RepID=A0A926NWL5_9SPHI|nr:hypothetical protein [Mucilaginibacter glaciei]MBD1395415.1 hypothetical protein [Mucilaginibacter glaciei]